MTSLPRIALCSIRDTCLPIKYAPKENRRADKLRRRAGFGRHAPERMIIRKFCKSILCYKF